MAYEKQKKLSSYTHEEMERMFHADSYEILGAKKVELARCEGQIAGEAIENPKRSAAAYNQVIAKYIFKEKGCSWREWKLDKLGEKPRGEVKKPVRKIAPSNVACGGRGDMDQDGSNFRVQPLTDSGGSSNDTAIRRLDAGGGSRPPHHQQARTGPVIDAASRI